MALKHYNPTSPARRGLVLIDKTQFAISTEETRYYLNGIYLHTLEVEGRSLLRAVATDGHRLARVDTAAPAGAAGMPGVIVPRKAVAEIQKLLEDGEAEVAVELSATKIRVATEAVVLTSKLIDGTFPDYQRVIPGGNDKRLTVDKGDFAASVDRVSTISSERGRAVKLSMADGRVEDAKRSVGRKFHGDLDDLLCNKIREDFGRIGSSTRLFFGDYIIALCKARLVELFHMF